METTKKNTRLRPVDVEKFNDVFEEICSNYCISTKQKFCETLGFSNGSTLGQIQKQRGASERFIRNMSSVYGVPYERYSAGPILNPEPDRPEKPAEGSQMTVNGYVTMTLEERKADALEGILDALRELVRVGHEISEKIGGASRES